MTKLTRDQYDRMTEGMLTRLSHYPDAKAIVASAMSKYDIIGEAPAATSGRAKPETGDSSTYDARVTAIRASNPTLPLAEAQRLARTHALEEHFYAPGIGESGLESLPINAPDDNGASIVDKLAADMDADPRVAEALRWDALSDVEKATERDGAALLKRMTALQADEAARAKANGITPLSLEVLLTNADAPEATRKAARAIHDQKQAAPASTGAWGLLDGIEE